MGIATTMLQILMLKSAKMDLEYKILTLNTAKMYLTTEQSKYVTAGSDLDADSPQVKMLEARKERLNLLERKLDLEMDQYKQELTQINENLNFVKTMNAESIRDFYSRG